MATVALKDIFLYDKWPGYPNFNLGKPTNGFDSTTSGSGNNVSTALYPIGTKIAVQYSPSDTTRWPGQSTFIYLQYHEGTDLQQDAGDPSDGYALCFKADGTATADGSIAGWYQVTNDLTNSVDGTIGGAVAFACTDLSDDEFGWFWCGGVAPVADVTRLAGDIKTNGDVIEGVELMVTDDGTNAGSLQPACLTCIYEVTLGYDATTTWAGPIGHSMQDDA